MHDHRKRGREAAANDPVPGRGGGAAGVPGKATLVRGTATIALPAALRLRLERALGADLAAVRVGEDPSVAAIGARAHASGTEVLFAPGEYRPESEAGQELIAHEVVHLVQQADGRVAATATVGGGTPINTDAGLEAEADELARRALRGERVRASAPSPRPADAPIQGSIDMFDKLAAALDTAVSSGAHYGNSFQPAPRSESDAHAQEARAAMAQDNLLISANDSARDPRTGLLPAQTAAVADFVAKANVYLGSWSEQRATPNLRFAHGEAMDNLYAEFRDQLAADPSFVLAWMEASKRLKLGPNRQYAREIRAFAPDLLGDYKRLLDFEDAAPSHSYEIMAEIAGGGSGSGFGVKVGAATRRMKVRYTNSLIRGLKWEQEIELTGLQLGLTIPGSKLKGGGSVEPPGSWKKAMHQPRATYLAPDFFAGAQYTRPSASLGGKLGAAKAGGSISQLLITNGADSLLWEMPASLKVSASGGKSVTEDPLKAGADAEGVIEAGRSTTVGDVEFHAGKWPTVVEQHEHRDEDWTPLHVARLYFPTGDSTLDGKDLRTLDELTAAIVKRDHMPGYEGSIFKVDVSGCHSQKWDGLDAKLRAYDERGDADLTPAERADRDELQASKDDYNDTLALDRADSAREALVVKLAGIDGALHVGVHAASTLAEPTTHEPIGDDHYTNRYEERSVLITVAYKLRSDRGRVPGTADIDLAADNRRAAEEMADAAD